MSKTPVYKAWKDIKIRCGNHPLYFDVSYDPGWEDFQVFYDEMKPRPEGNYAIDKDLFGNSFRHYSKETCVWMTANDNLRLANAMRNGHQDIIDELREIYEPLRPIHS